jgi:hypothetical protein
MILGIHGMDIMSFTEILISGPAIPFMEVGVISLDMLIGDITVIPSSIRFMLASEEVVDRMVIPKRGVIFRGGVWFRTVPPE